MSVFSAAVLGAGTAEEIVERTGLPPGSGAGGAQTHRRRAVELRRGQAVAHVTAFKDTIREYAEQAPPDEPLDPDRARAAVLRAFVSEGRLVAIPATRGKRLVILEHMVAAFEPGMKYPEREVDAVLRAWHPDYASLRRYLIDEGLMAREDGVYWRTGGPVELS